MNKILLLLFSAILFSSYSFEFKLPVHYDTLDNGLRVIIVPDTNVAVVSCRLYYFVGSMYEGPGTTGLSHMYEHMMFKGTRRLGTSNFEKERPIMRKIDSLDVHLQQQRQNRSGVADTAESVYMQQILKLLEKQRQFIKKDEIWELYQNNGGTHLNAWTSDDMTAYIVTLPENKIELFYWIESDRMRNPVLREFHSEREVVAEERRMRYDNRPVSKYWERLNALFYVAHPYRLPTIGWNSDIESYTRKGLEEHVYRYYTPDNALIVLSGSVDPAQALRDIKRYFGTVPRAAQPKKEVVTREPPPAGQTRFTMQEQAESRLDMMFHTPGYPHDDLYRIDVIEALFSGRSGRLYKRLVDEEGLCTDAGASNGLRLHDGYFHIWAELKQGVDPRKVERIIGEEIAKLTQALPTDREMLRIKNEIRMSFVTGLGSLEGLSDRLAWFERLRTWKDLLTYPDEIASVKKEEIRITAKKYLDIQLATIGLLIPGQEKAPDRDKGATPAKKVGKK
jgi:predicted Zn-dependent peptidase